MLGCTQGQKFGISSFERLAMAKAVKQEPKKPYSKPTFIVYGTVQELRLRAARRDRGDCTR